MQFENTTNIDLRLLLTRQSIELVTSLALLLGDTSVFAVFDKDAAVDLRIVKGSLLIATSYECPVVCHSSGLFEDAYMKSSFLAVVVRKNARDWLELLVILGVPDLNRAVLYVSLTSLSG